MNLRLIGNRVRIMPLKPQSRTPAGIHLLDNATGSEFDIKMFRVMQVSPKVSEVREGDRVYADLAFDAHVLPDGSKIADASQVKLIIPMQCEKLPTGEVHYFKPGARDGDPCLCGEKLRVTRGPLDAA